MPETKKYAVLCSTEEQARECKENIGGYIHWNLYYLTDCGFFWHIDYVSKNWYITITYEEAVGLGLLGDVSLTIEPLSSEEKETLSNRPQSLIDKEQEMDKLLKSKEEMKEESNKIEELESIDFNLPDVSEMFDKINEIIRHLNK